MTLKFVVFCAQFTIPYLDPALPLQIRTEALRMNYGFTCTCPICTFQNETVLSLRAPPRNSTEGRALDIRLFNFTTNHILSLEPHGRICNTVNTCLPEDLHCVFDPQYLPALSEEFSKSSHEGAYDLALSAGRSLLALYAIIYPAYYPQIGTLCIFYSRHRLN